MKIFKYVIIVVGGIISLSLLVSGRSTGVGVKPFLNAGYWTYFPIAALIAAFIPLSKRIRVISFLGGFILAHLACTVEESWFRRKLVETNNVDPVARFLDGSCWVSYDFKNNKLLGGD